MEIVAKFSVDHSPDGLTLTPPLLKNEDECALNTSRNLFFRTNWDIGWLGIS